MAPPPKKDRNSDTSAINKPLVILAKPPDKKPTTTTQIENAPNSPTSSKELKPPTVLQKAREGTDQDGSRAASPSLSKESEAFADFVKNVSQKVYHIQQKPSSTHTTEDQKLSLPAEMPSPLKLIDESLQWCDNALEYLHDGGEFYVIGVLGLQGSGKSTVLSLLTGSPTFKVQTLEMKELGEHCTSGIDIYVTNERVILLDAQPLLSASVMDHMIQYEKYEKKPLGGADYYSVESTLYIQSMQIVAFLMCVCHTIITVQDWFIDANYLRFLLACEMLKPSRQVVQFDAKSEMLSEHFPHLVFVQNKASHKDLMLSSVEEMEMTLDSILKCSKLKYTGTVHPELDLSRHSDCPNVNLFLLPSRDDEDYGPGQFPSYKGRSSFQSLSKLFTRQILSMPHQMITYFATSEKNWFYYATRIWDIVKKSNDFNEYRRHLISFR